MLTKPRFLFFLLKRKFYNSENNDSDNNNNDNSNNYANNHNNYDNKMKSRNGKPTEDPLCSKKEKHRWFSLYLSFLLQISREFHFSLYSFFLGVAIRFLHEYIYIYINLCHSLSLRYGARCVRRAWVYLKVELINKTYIHT